MVCQHILNVPPPGFQSHLYMQATFSENSLPESQNHLFAEALSNLLPLRIKNECFSFYGFICLTCLHVTIHGDILPCNKDGISSAFTDSF